MANRGIVKAIIMILIFINVRADPKVIMLTPEDSVRRSDWQPMTGGWPAPMQPPKIIIVKSPEGSEGGGEKEDKLESLMPILMTLGPILLIAILLPVFMSLITGIMGFIKNLLAMKMPMMQMVPMSMMPMMPMMPVNVPGKSGILAADSFLSPIHKQTLFRARNQNSSSIFSIPVKADDMMLAKNLTALEFSGI